jgi:tyrosinase
MQVNLGPAFAAMDGIVPNGDGRGYNPRCLRRDLSPIAANWTTHWYTHDLITNSQDIYWFQTVMQGDFARGEPGVHGGGHHTVGGDPGSVSVFPFQFEA